MYKEEIQRVSFVEGWTERTQVTVLCEAFERLAKEHGKEFSYLDFFKKFVESKRELE